MQLLWFVVIIFLYNAREIQSAAAPVNSIPMRVVNNAGAPIELFWIDVFTKKEESFVKQTQKPIRNNTDTTINSYDTHAFMVKFLNPSKNTEGRFVKGPREEVITIRYDEAANEFDIRQTTKFDEIMDTIGEATKVCSEVDDGNSDSFSKCVAEGVFDDISRLTDSKLTTSKYRDIIAQRLRNYTCADELLQTTEAISSSTTRIAGKQYKVDTLLDMSHAKIWMVEDFITPQECAILEKHGKSKLKRATVAAEDGTSVVSEHRKAQQAAYNFQHGQRNVDPLWPLYTRVLAMTNDHAGMSLHPDGQEDFTIIQYNADDQYTPHCDGTCDNTMHNSGGRVATAVLYCKVAKRGGATTFTKADVFVNPKPGMATFFSYKGPDGRMDEGYTEHSGCPVIEGEKWITTVWMREGVTADQPWTLFDPSGVKLMTEGEYAPEEAAEGEESHDEL